MSPLLPDPTDDQPGRGGYRLIAPTQDVAEPYLKSLGLHMREVVTKESELFGFSPKMTTLILLPRRLLERADTNLIFRVQQMADMGARLMTYEQAVAERRTYVRNRDR